MVNPVRIRVDSKSIEPMVQACVNIFSSEGSMPACVRCRI